MHTTMKDDHMIVQAPPSPPSSSFMHHDDEKGDDMTVLETLSGCQDNVKQAQHCLEEQYRRGVLLRSFSDPAPAALNKANIMDCHRLAIEALQHLYVEERRRHASLEREAEAAKEQVTKLQQELAYQKRQHTAEKREWQKDLTRVYEMAETVYDVSSPAHHRSRKHIASSPAELQSRLYDILTNTLSLQQHPCTSSVLADDLL